MLELLAALLIANPSTPRIELASPDDCAVIVAVGKARMGWGEKPPASGFYPDSSLPGGGVYREACPWKRLGVADPVLGTAATPQGFAISRPVFDSSRTHAIASLETTAKPRFAEVQTCRLEKAAGQWRVISCDVTLIT